MSHLHEEKIKQLENQANEIRTSIIEMLIETGSGHTAGPLGMADIFTLLYFHILKHDAKNPDWEERDRLVLSNGHICPVLYAAMAHAGYFPTDDLKTLRKFGSKLQGHPHKEWLLGLETSSGPLGSGLSQAVGMALAMRMDTLATPGLDSHSYIYCLMSDGELDAGNSWEGALLAGKEKLHNIITIIDRNNIQIDGFTEDVMPLEPLRDKWESFGWHVIDADGHDFYDMAKAIGQSKAVYEKPSVIIAHTIPGKGVSFAEKDYRYHGDPPGKWPDDVIAKGDQATAALEELRTLGGKIESEHE